MLLDDLSDELGKILTSYSRRVLNSYLSEHITLPFLSDPPVLKEKSGIFCTLRKFGQLRGCIGFPYPTHPLGEAHVKSTLQAAVDDPRFPAVSFKELSDITIELTVLTPPQLISVQKFEDYYEQIKIGLDGLIIEHKSRRGLLLPQVPVEQHWDIDDYLEGICQKAYLSPETWKNVQSTKLYKFNGKIFDE
jgi:hypothetical protein